MPAAIKHSAMRALRDGRLETLDLVCPQKALNNYALFLSHAPALHTIKIEVERSTKMNAEGMKHVLTILSNPTITNFTLTNAEMDESQFRMLMKAVSRKHSLKTLILDNCRANDANGIDLAAMLKKHPGLTRCDVKENTYQMRAIGAEALVEVPCHNPRLVQLLFRFPLPDHDAKVGPLIDDAVPRWINPNLSGFGPSTKLSRAYTQENMQAARATVLNCARAIEDNDHDALTQADKVKLCYMMPLIETMMANLVENPQQTPDAIRALAAEYQKTMPWVNPALPTSVSDLVKDGKPTSLLEGFAQSRKLGTLFSLDRWEGKTAASMSRVYRAMPEAWQAQVPNYHQLNAALGRGQKHEGRAA